MLLNRNKSLEIECWWVRSSKRKHKFPQIFTCEPQDLGYHLSGVKSTINVDAFYTIFSKKKNEKTKLQYINFPYRFESIVHVHSLSHTHRHPNTNPYLFFCLRVSLFERKNNIYLRIMIESK